MPLSTKDITQDNTNLFLFIGPADSGKSFAASSFGLASKEYGGEDERPAYMIEMDGRIHALRGRPIVYDPFTNIEGAIGVLKKVIELRNIAVKFNKCGFHTLIIDSFTSFCDFSLADSLEITELKNAEKPNEEKGRKRGELSLATVEDYGYEAEAVRKLLWENLLDLKKFCNIIVTAHEVPNYIYLKTKPGEPTKQELDPINKYKILTHGNKIAARLPTKFDEIYHFMGKEVIIATHTIRRSVVFQDGLARSSFPQLCGTTDTFDISGKEFYTFWKEKINGKVKI